MVRGLATRAVFKLAVMAGIATSAMVVPATAQALLSYDTCVAAASETVTTCPSTAPDSIDAGLGAALSPDGANLYVTGLNDVGIFSTSGGLNYLGDLPNPHQITGGGGVGISPDGLNAYLSDGAYNLLWTYTRAVATGALTNPSCINQLAGDASCTGYTPGLTAPSVPVVSPDGRNVYVVGNPQYPGFYSSIDEFDRDVATGALASTGCIGSVASSGCGTVDATLLGLEDLVTSANGRFVYATSNPVTVGYPTDRSSAISVCARNSLTGALTPVACYGNFAGCSPLPNIGFSGGYSSALPERIALSPDGTQLYVTEETGNISGFSINHATGTLTFAGCIGASSARTTCATLPPDIVTDLQSDYLNGFILASTDGRDLYVLEKNNLILEFARNTGTGVLSFAGCIGPPDLPAGVTACSETARGLDFANAFTLSPDGSTMYTVSTGNLYQPGPNPSTGGVIDVLSRTADTAAATPPPAVLTSSTVLGGTGLTFGKRAHPGKGGHRASGVITLTLRCPAGVTRYCAGSVAVRGRPLSIVGLTKANSRLTVRVRVSLSKAQRATLKALGHVKITVVFVQRMPNGGLRQAKGAITITSRAHTTHV